MFRCLAEDGNGDTVTLVVRGKYTSVLKENAKVIVMNALAKNDYL